MKVLKLLLVFINDFEVTNATEANTEAGKTTDINAETSNAIDAVAATENKVTC